MASQRQRLIWVWAVITIIAGTAMARAQTAGTPVELPIDWAVGETHRFEMIKTRETRRGQAPGITTRNSTDVEIEVLAKTPDGYRLQWTFGQSSLRSDVGANRAMAERMANITAGMRLVLAMDRRGAITGLENIGEIVGHYQETTAQIVQWLRRAGAAPQLVDQITQATRHLLDPQLVGFLSLKEPSLYFLAFGGSYRLHEKSAYQDTLPNPFGGPSFPTNAYFLLSDLNTAANQATVDWAQSVDARQAAPILLDTITRLAERSGRPRPTEEEAAAFVSAFSIEDEARYVFDLDSGWPRSARHRRSSTIQTLRKIDQVEFIARPK